MPIYSTDIIEFSLCQFYECVRICVSLASSNVEHFCVMANRKMFNHLFFSAWCWCCCCCCRCFSFIQIMHPFVALILTNDDSSVLASNALDSSESHAKQTPTKTKTKFNLHKFLKEQLLEPNIRKIYGKYQSMECLLAPWTVAGHCAGFTIIIWHHICIKRTSSPIKT